MNRTYRTYRAHGSHEPYKSYKYYCMIIPKIFGESRMKILIAGAGGQLGRALQTVLAGHEIIALTHARLDVTRFKDTCEAVAAHRPDVVINAAAYTDVDGAESDQSGAY